MWRIRESYQQSAALKAKWQEEGGDTKGSNHGLKFWTLDVPEEVSTGESARPWLHCLLPLLCLWHKLSFISWSNSIWRTWEALILCLPLMLVQPSLFTNTTDSKALVCLTVTKENSLWRCSWENVLNYRTLPLSVNIISESTKLDRTQDHPTTKPDNLNILLSRCSTQSLTCSVNAQLVRSLSSSTSPSSSGTSSSSLSPLLVPSVTRRLQQSLSLAVTASTALPASTLTSPTLVLTPLAGRFAAAQLNRSLSASSLNTSLLVTSLLPQEELAAGVFLPLKRFIVLTLLVPRLLLLTLCFLEGGSLVETVIR